ncbi:hypothetical protein MA16_Dca002665 [Dendrobium catenatum]|uniref:Uncharacterized protein n=1 Tax=Dendrobium catenatum TaxID=906689 RepID=A0A2I0X8B0_9ASPA|nr:hypothetical protein MA16_Dca002665 [Dendrobium catenatum]
MERPDEKKNGKKMVLAPLHLLVRHLSMVNLLELIGIPRNSSCTNLSTRGSVRPMPVSS